MSCILELYDSTNQLIMDFLIHSPRKEVAIFIKEILLNKEKAFFMIETDESEFIYPKNLLQTMSIIVKDANHSEKVKLDERAVGKVAMIEDYLENSNHHSK